jgi:hypothetical protein
MTQSLITTLRKSGASWARLGPYNLQNSKQVLPKNNSIIRIPNLRLPTPFSVVGKEHGCFNRSTEGPRRERDRARESKAGAGRE